MTHTPSPQPPELDNHVTVTHQRFSTLVTCWILITSSLIVLGALVPLFQLDFHILLFLRSIRLPILEEAGRIGNTLGHGMTLVLISIGLGIVGYGWKQERFKHAMWQSLIAHGIAGLIIQIMKHLLGRPRPRFTHQESWQIGPSFQGGLDAFPSGHSAASFAVAAVLARHFPGGTWVWYGLAGIVAVSRVAKGSHFPSDALTGALIGIVIGYVLSRPLQRWIASLIEALIQALPYWVGGFALVWITFHHSETGALYSGMYWGGLLTTAVGAGTGVFLRITHASDARGRTIDHRNTNIIMGLGLALFTESLLVTLLALLTGLSWWAGNVSRHQTGTIEPQPIPNTSKLLTQEVLIKGAVICLLVGIHELKGLVPLN